MLFRTVAFFCLFFLTKNNLRAQLCTGSLGDPIVNITFGSGPNPGPPLAAAATGYQFRNADCPDDGFYTVRNNTTSCFGNSWHSLTSDHTGDPNGYFMLVNASLQPSAFYVQAVQGLCANTTYEFAAWIMNVMQPSACGGTGIQPNLTFNIETTSGTVLQTYNTGNIPATPSPIWRQFGFFFNTPANVNEVVMRLINNATGGCGNDIALDDITFRPCGPQLSTSFVGLGTDTVKLCEGATANYSLLGNASPGFANPVYQWQARTGSLPWTDIPNANSLALVAPIPAITPPGIYQFRLSAANAGNIDAIPCRVNSLPLTIVVDPQVTATATSNSPLCEGNNLVLSTSGSQTFTWTGPNGFADTGVIINVPQVELSQSGTYTLKAESAAGCVDEVDIEVNISPKPLVTLASADTAVCLGDSTQLFATGDGTFSWSPALGLSATNTANTTAAPDTFTTYKVVVTNDAGCVDSSSIDLNVYTLPTVDAGPDKTIVAGTGTLLEGSLQGQWLRFFWNTAPDISSTDSLQPLVNPSVNTFYVLNAEALNGCGIISDTVNVLLFDAVYVPNAFSPNGDGLNDRWNIPALAAYPEFELNVYSRYGKLVYSQKAILQPWDGNFNGKPLPIGTYVYKIRLNSDIPLLSGTVQILR